ncbi:MAG: trimethylamine methyltransferase family protein [Planctomycetota bacterium]
MTTATTPRVRFLSSAAVRGVVGEAKRILAEVGVRVEYAGAVELLAGAGAVPGEDGRIRLFPGLVDRSLATVPREIVLYDRDGENPLRLGAGALAFAPGSAALHVHEPATGRLRPAVREDCRRFAHLTELLPALALQSTCVVPNDEPVEHQDRARLREALVHCRKPIVTGTFAARSFPVMARMLECVRGGPEGLRAKPLAIFDCCPTAPLAWSELTCGALAGSAERGIPAELISMPMTGATAPVTLIGAVVQHAAESLSGVVIHQLAGPGAPLVWGACASAFDMRLGTAPLAAVETLMIDCAAAEVGRHLGLPTHAYFTVSDAKILDAQCGAESGFGAALAALAGFDVISGPGLLELGNCQSLEKLVLDHELCRQAHRLAAGIALHPENSLSGILRDGLAAGRFLDLEHTLRHHRSELHRPGPTVDRQVAGAWLASGAPTAAQRARAEVERLLAAEGAPPLAAEVEAELDRLVEA